MEPDRYWFLYLGLLFIFLGSEIGQSICLRAMYLVRACFYLALALLFAAAALFFRVLGAMLLWFALRWARGEAKEKEGRNFRGGVE